MLNNKLKKLFEVKNFIKERIFSVLDLKNKKLFFELLGIKFIIILYIFS
jgi:hypothetical protein